MEEFVLRLFVAGKTPVAVRARENLACLRDGALRGRCRVIVVDVLDEPAEAERHRIIATPTLLKESPAPAKRLIGDLSDQAILFEVLGVVVAPAPTAELQKEAQ